MTYASLVAAAALIAVSQPAAAQGFKLDPNLAPLGEQLWNETAPCRNCHGSAANGVHDVPQEPDGPNLHLTQLTPEMMVEVIRCGRPGTEMPYFDAGAYTDKRCYDLTAADLGNRVPKIGAPQLNARQLSGLVSFIFERFVGKP